MSKRKREADIDPGSHASDDRLNALLLSRQQREVLHVFTQSSKQLAQAFKLAKGFERQKLGRRKKTAVQEGAKEAEERIDVETAALKTLETVPAAQHYLAKSLLKIKEIASSPALHADLRTPPATASMNAATLNITARLCNSNPVKAALPTAINAVKRELGLKESPQPSGRKRRLRAKDFQTGAQDSNQAAAQPLEDRPSSELIEKLRSASTAKRAAVDEREVSDDDMDHDAHHLAPYEDASDDEFDDFGSTSDIADLERQLEQEGLSKSRTRPVLARYDHAADLSLSEDDDAASDSESDVPEPQKAPPALKKSAFIPSLTLGGYISGSGSDLDDDLDTAPKKNRRGQRARQAIWEKKYGTKAKHLSKPDRNQGWDPKRGAAGPRAIGRTDRNSGRPAAAHRSQRALPTDHRPPPRRDGGAVQQKPRRDDSGPLHPSWEAAKRAKEKKAAPAVFQGKKITFD